MSLFDFGALPQVRLISSTLFPVADRPPAVSKAAARSTNLFTAPQPQQRPAHVGVSQKLDLSQPATKSSAARAPHVKPALGKRSTFTIAVSSGDGNQPQQQLETPQTPVKRPAYLASNPLTGSFIRGVSAGDTRMGDVDGDADDRLSSAAPVTMSTAASSDPVELGLDGGFVASPGSLPEALARRRPAPIPAFRATVEPSLESLSSPLSGLDGAGFGYPTRRAAGKDVAPAGGRTAAPLLAAAPRGTPASAARRTSPSREAASRALEELRRHALTALPLALKAAAHQATLQPTPAKPDQPAAFVVSPAPKASVGHGQQHQQPVTPAPGRWGDGSAPTNSGSPGQLRPSSQGVCDDLADALLAQLLQARGGGGGGDINASSGPREHSLLPPSHPQAQGGGLGQSASAVSRGRALQEARDQARYERGREILRARAASVVGATARGGATAGPSTAGVPRRSSSIGPGPSASAASSRRGSTASGTGGGGGIPSAVTSATVAATPGDGSARFRSASLADSGARRLSVAERTTTSTVAKQAARAPAPQALPQWLPPRPPALVAAPPVASEPQLLPSTGASVRRAPLPVADYERDHRPFTARPAPRVVHRRARAAAAANTLLQSQQQPRPSQPPVDALAAIAQLEAKLTQVGLLKAKKAARQQATSSSSAASASGSKLPVPGLAATGATPAPTTQSQATARARADIAAADAELSAMQGKRAQVEGLVRLLASQLTRYDDGDEEDGSDDAVREGGSSGGDANGARHAGSLKQLLSTLAPSRNASAPASAPASLSASTLSSTSVHDSAGALALDARVEAALSRAIQATEVPPEGAAAAATLADRPAPLPPIAELFAAVSDKPATRGTAFPVSSKPAPQHTAVKQDGTPRDAAILSAANEASHLVTEAPSRKQSFVAYAPQAGPSVRQRLEAARSPATEPVVTRVAAMVTKAPTAASAAEEGSRQTTSLTTAMQPSLPAVLQLAGAPAPAATGTAVKPSGTGGPGDVKALVAASMARVQAALEGAAATMRVTASAPEMSVTGRSPARLFSVTGTLAGRGGTSDPMRVTLSRADPFFIGDDSGHSGAAGKSVYDGAIAAAQLRSPARASGASREEVPATPPSTTFARWAAVNAEEAEDSDGAALLDLMATTRRELDALSPARVLQRAQGRAEALREAERELQPQAPAVVSIACAECDEAPAAKLCHECGDPFCEVCFASLHAKGSRRGHAFSLIETDPFAVTESSASLAPAPLSPSVKQKFVLRDFDLATLGDASHSAVGSTVGTSDRTSGAAGDAQRIVRPVRQQAATPGPLPLRHLHGRLGIALRN